MNSLYRRVGSLVVLLISGFAFAQQAPEQNHATALPRLIRISASVGDASAKHSGVAGAVLALYASESGGSALWSEVQNVRVDNTGHFTVLLGAGSADGVPLELFATGEVRWLGISVDGKEQRRIQLVSVPYALKAKDAETLNGLTAAEIAAQAAALNAPSGAATVLPDSKPNGASSGSIVNHAAISATATDFTDSTTIPVVSITQNSTGAALTAINASTTNNTINGTNTAGTGTVRGVYGESNSTGTSSAGVYGISKAISGTTYGVLGVTNSTHGTALNGTATSITGATIGLRGQSNSSSGMGVQGINAAGSGLTTGVNGVVLSSSGVAGVFDNRAGGQILSLANNGTEMLSVNGTGDVTTTGNVTATGVYTGNGSGLTNLNASNLASGAVPDAALSGTYSNAVTFSNAGDVFAGLAANSNALNGFPSSKFLQINPASAQISTSPNGASTDAALLLNMNGNTTLPSFTAIFRVDNASGLLAKGTLGYGAIPFSGAGERMMWHPYKAAFRAGSIGSSGTFWDDPNVGFYTWAGGYNTIALGLSSFAMGYQSQALGSYSNALGYSTIAGGTGSVALGYRSGACADYSTAIGQRALTSEDVGSTTVCGTILHAGAIVIADGSTTNYVNAQANNEFRVRAAGGFKLRTSSAANAAPGASSNTGCDLPAGSGTWTCSSSRTIKENFHPVLGRDVLSKVRAMPISTWNYIQEGQQVKHLGPVAEDFYSAFKLGPEASSIGINDLAGVGIAAVQELDQKVDLRVRELQKENQRLKAQLAMFQARLDRLERGTRATTKEKKQQ